MERKTIEHEHNVVHYLSKRKIDNKSGKAHRHVFQLRGGENGLSVNWLEYFANIEKSKQLEKVQYYMLQTNYGLKASGRFAELNVGKTIHKILEKHNIKIEVIHSPTKPNRCHALICGLPKSQTPWYSPGQSRTLLQS